MADRQAFAAYLAPLRNSEWVVYCKRPFGGPEEVLRYLARYTHRVAISNRRLIALDDNGVTFKWKDYRIDGPERYKLMTLDTHEFIRRFLMHVLPSGFHRIRYSDFIKPAPTTGDRRHKLGAGLSTNGARILRCRGFWDNDLAPSFRRRFLPGNKENSVVCSLLAKVVSWLGGVPFSRPRGLSFGAP